MMSRWLPLKMIFLLAAAIWTVAESRGGAPGDTQEQQAPATAPGVTAEAKGKATAAAWKPLDIRPAGSWVECRFGGDGPIEIKDGVISLGFGDPLTGVRWEGEFPQLGYEISLEARRTGGFDFFCGLTLPVGDQRCSLILGGWGGSLVGISSIDGLDASNNETMLIRQFEQDRWYKVRVEVTGERLRAWLDEEKIVDFERDERPLDIRSEMEQTTPVGIAAFQCQSQIRGVRVRKLDGVAAGKDAAEPPGQEVPGQEVPGKAPGAGSAAGSQP
jgi:hypothetical protein